MPDWKKYKKKEIIVEAFYYKGGYVHGIVNDKNGYSMITMKTGDIPVKKGDYIIKTGNGNYSIMSSDKFLNEYFPLVDTNEDLPFCPCCGSSASIVKKENEGNKGISFYVRCSNKNCRLRTKSCGSKLEATQIWSKRS